MGDGGADAGAADAEGGTVRTEQTTPGPWKWFDYPDGRKLLAAPSQAVIHCPDAPMSIDPGDAVLIASAPEMRTELDQVAQILARDMVNASNGPLPEPKQPLGPVALCVYGAVQELRASRAEVARLTAALDETGRNRK